MSNPEESRQSPAGLDIDYRETSNITHVHAAIRREKRDPLSDSVPIPLWLMGVFFLIFGWGVYYLGEFNGGYSADVFNERAGLGPSRHGGGAGGEAAAAPETPVERGKNVFMSNCATCHQPTGLGVPGQYPPLAGSEIVNGSPKRLAMILLKGLQGQITVAGKTVNGQMPVWASLGDRKISDVLTYIRQEWGNKGGPVSEAQIDHAKEEFKDRTEPWSPQDILAVPDNAVLEGAPAPAASPAAPAAPPK